ncbi:sensor histidine kinase [Pseudonocardia sichuanensis]
MSALPVPLYAPHVLFDEWDEDCGQGRRGVVLVATMVVLVALTVVSWSDRSAASGLLPLDIAVGVLACGLLPLMLRRTVPVALVLVVLAVLSPAATPPATCGTLLVAQRRPLVVAIAVGLAGVAGHAVQGLWRPTAGLAFVWWLVLAVVAHAALVASGALTRARRALLASLRERARRAEAEQAQRVAAARSHERTLIAREMHDVLAHRLSLVAASAGALEYRPDASPEKVARAAGVVRAGVHQALEELREVIGVLRADGTDPAADRPQPVLADLPALLAESRDAGAVVHVDDRVTDPAAAPVTTGRTAYRIVQEGLTNARKHAPGGPVHVRLEGGPGDGLLIELRNPVPGGPPEAPPGSGTGLVGLAERAQLAGGTLGHEITPDGRFRLHAALPWPP